VGVPAFTDDLMVKIDRIAARRQAPVPGTR
jgi:hypothetical protein